MFSQITIVGRTCADSELKVLDNGKRVRNMRVAVNRTEAGVQVADFFKVTEWLRDDQKSFQITKGSQVLCSGSLKMESYKNRQGETVMQPVVIYPTVRVLGNKAETTEATVVPRFDPIPVVNSDPSLDEMPF